MSEENKGQPLMSLQHVDLYYETRRGLFKPPLRVGAAVDISLDIHKGEVLAIVGESGCGKTTLGNVIIGMLKPTAGKLYFNGKDVYGKGKAAFREYRNSMIPTRP